ncbi:unnamed protein product, partial [Brachionus calyciflorus]
VLKSESFNAQEIVIILIAGVGIPILCILVGVIFYKIVLKKNDQVKDEENGKMNETKSLGVQQEKQIKKENIYVICQSNMNQVVAKTDLTPKMNEIIKNTSNKKSNFTETEVYSNCIYEDLNEYVKQQSEAKISSNLNMEQNKYLNDLVTYV